MIGRILDHARRTPTRDALVHNGAAWSYAEFARRIVACRERLRREGVRPGTVAVICIDRLQHAWVAALALRGMGVTTIAVGDAMNLEELALRGVSCVVAIDGEEHGGVASAAAEAGWRWIRLPARQDPAATQPPGEAGTAPNEAMPAGHILLTSGTTGAYKKVLRDPAAEAGAIASHAGLYGISGASVVYAGNFPLWTAGGHRWPTLTWFEGGTVVLQDCRDMHEPFRRLRPTHAFATPATLAYLLETAPAGSRRDDALQLVVTAGALPVAMARRARESLAARVSTLFASTEAAAVTLTRFERADDLLWHRVIDSRRVEVVDEAGRLLPHGEVGLIRVGLLDGITGYLDDEAATRQFFRDGHFYPGDLGQLRQDGRLSLHGRVTDVINVMGNKIATAPIERALQDRLGADGVCLLSLEAGGADEEVHVVIESRQPIPRAELAAIAAAELRGFARAHFHVLAELPRNTMGKVRRDVLRRRIVAGGRE